MITDALLLFCNSQTINTTEVSDNSVNIELVGDSQSNTTQVRDIGRGQPLYVWIRIEPITYSAADSGSLTIGLVSDDDSALGSNTDVQTLCTINSASADTVYNTMYVFPISNLTMGASQQYLGLEFTKSGTFLSTEVTAGICAENPGFVAYNKSPYAKILTT